MMIDIMMLKVGYNQQLANTNMRESSSSEEMPSIQSKTENRGFKSCSREQLSKFMDLIKNALKNYEDVNQDDFVLLDEVNQNPFQHTSSSYMINDHHSLVQIGTNFQASIPPIMTEVAYQIKSKDRMKALKILKIHDPQQGEEFYQRYFEMIEQLYGPGRTYEDVNHLRNSYRKMSSYLTLEEYLSKYNLHWQSQFKAKDKETSKLAQKKRKKKGAINT